MRERLGLPVLAVVLVAAVLGIQLGNGGGRFEPLRTADPCVDRRVDSTTSGIDGLTERLVLLGLDGAACRLGTSREALTLGLAEPGGRSHARLEALRAGLLEAVGRMKRDGELPRASALLDESLDEIELNGLLEAAIRALPDAAVDAALKTDDVLRRTIRDLDLEALVADLDDQQDLEQQIQDAVLAAVKDSLVDRVRNLV